MADYNMFTNYFNFSFGSGNVQNESGARPVLGRRVISASDDSLEITDCWIKSRTNSSSTDVSLMSLESNNGDKTEDVDTFDLLSNEDDLFVAENQIPSQSASFQEFCVENPEPIHPSAKFHELLLQNKESICHSATIHGSTCFYKNIGSDYNSVEEFSPPKAPSLFDGNLQQMNLEMLKSLSISPGVNMGIYDNETMMPYKNGRTLDVIKHCAFCKRNGETREFYSTHIVKDSRGKVVCPILRKYVCPICKATGDQAHTLRHCPFKLKTALQPTC